MKTLIARLLGPSIEDRFFDKYNKEQNRKALRSVYTASSRPVKPGVLQEAQTK